jgi:hypothetical protein
MQEERIEYTVLVGKREEKWPLEKPRQRHKNNIKNKNPKEIGL